MGWNVNRLLHGYQNYWQAPIFHPTDGAFAFSDPQPLAGLLGAPWWNIHPALAHNFVLLLFLTLNGWSVFLLLRHRDAPLVPALLVGLFAQAIPFLARERGVLQLQPLFGMVWAVGAAWSLVEKTRWQAAVALGFGTAVTFLTSEYYGLFLLVFLAPLGLWAAFRSGRKSKYWLNLLLAVGIAAIFVLPVTLPQRAFLDDAGFSRSARAIRNSSATFSDYLQPPAEVLESRIFPAVSSSGQRLFPGVALLLLGGVGAVHGLRNTNNRSWTLYLLGTAFLALLLSLGLNLEVGGWRPYQLVRDYVPGFKYLRSPFRLGLWVQISLVLLAGQALSGFWKNRGKWLWIVVALLCIIELLPLPTRLAPAPEPVAFEGIDPPVIFLPMPDGTSAAAYEQTTIWMIQSLGNNIPLLNGYSGFFPPQHAHLKVLMADFPTEESIAALQNLGVRTILIRIDWIEGNRQTALKGYLATNELMFLGEQHGLMIYQLNGTPTTPTEQSMRLP